jgi:AhpD family alkylhydroperoxidase
MTKRANYLAIAPQAMDILMQQEAYLKQAFSQTEPLTLKMLELVKLRISQINQCAFCIDMHSKQALNDGESYPRIIGLSAWRDIGLYSKLELAALDWAEKITQGTAVDEVYYTNMVQQLGETGLVNLTIAINAINSWNRIAKTFKSEIK